jgi:hypothetical protein
VCWLDFHLGWSAFGYTRPDKTAKAASLQLLGSGATATWASRTPVSAFER